eukprot:scaffold218085_cov16-Prasinocladus_malaysianus.AAC.1
MVGAGRQRTRRSIQVSPSVITNNLVQLRRVMQRMESRVGLEAIAADDRKGFKCRLILSHSDDCSNELVLI